MEAFGLKSSTLEHFDKVWSYGRLWVFGQSRLWISGSMMPCLPRRPRSTGPYWPWLTVRLNWPRTSPNVISSYCPLATRATVDRTLCELSDFSECVLFLRSTGDNSPRSTLALSTLKHRATSKTSNRGCLGPWSTSQRKPRSTGQSSVSSNAEQPSTLGATVDRPQPDPDPTRIFLQPINRPLNIFFSVELLGENT